jgi:outer membrane protein assembly factor BamB
MIKHILLPTAMCLLPLVAAAADDDSQLSNWPHWRGPLANGVAPQADPPVKWDATTSIAWKAPLPGGGSASPIVWEDRVFTVTAVETDRVPETPPKADPNQRTAPPNRYYRYVVLCFDRNSGEKLWEQLAIEAVPHEGIHGTHSYAASSPTTDGERLYVSFGSRGLFCYDLDGNRIWDRDLGDARTRLGWGEAVTPVIAGDHLVVNWDTEDESFIIALDPASGETKWKEDRDEATGWTTPLIVEHEGREQVIVNGSNRVRSYDLETGELIWQSGGQTVNAIPSPVYDASSVYVTSGYRGAALQALPIDAKGDITGSNAIRWEVGRGTPYVPSPLLYEGRLYITQGNTNVLTCLDSKTGKPLFGPQRIDGIANMYASPVAAAGKVYFTGREGTTVVIKAADEYEVLSTNALGEPIDASPALVGEQLFLRSSGHLFCIEDGE